MLRKTARTAQPETITATEVRRQYAAGRRDFDFVDISGRKLSGSNLRAASFYCARMRDVDLRDSYLTYIQLKGADLNGAKDFRGTLKSKKKFNAALNRLIDALKVKAP